MTGSVESTIEGAVARQDHDLQLVLQARAGDSNAFDELFTRHRRYVYNICHRMLGNAEDAVDATQAAFIAAFKGLARFRGEAAFRTWMYRIAINECNAILRRKHRTREDVEAAVACEEAPVGDVQGDDLVHEAILRLPPDMRAVLVLFYYQELSSREIAQALGCSDGAVRVRLHRARTAFKKQFEEMKP